MKYSGRPNIAELVDTILEEAVQFGASDVHFEPTRTELQVKYRMDGTLKVVEALPAAVRDNVISRLKVLGNLLTYRNDIPQEGRIEGHTMPAVSEFGKVIDKRLAVFPTIHGQRAVVRIFYENEALTELDKLGFSPAIQSSLKEFAHKNQGILLLRVRWGIRTLARGTVPRNARSARRVARVRCKKETSLRTRQPTA